MLNDHKITWKIGCHSKSEAGKSDDNCIDFIVFLVLYAWVKKKTCKVIHQSHLYGTGRRNGWVCFLVPVNLYYYGYHGYIHHTSYHDYCNAMYATMLVTNFNMITH